MALLLTTELLQQIWQHGQAAYPEEGAGFLLGSGDHTREVKAIFPLPNTREDGARHNRYLIRPQDMLLAEQEAARLGMDVVGVFHSHPDHPDQPSEFDRDWALPWFSYIITTVQGGRALSSRSWRLAEDRSRFSEESIQMTEMAHIE